MLARAVLDNGTIYSAVMPKRKPHIATEYFYFTIDDWKRGYGFEVNRHKWEFSPDHYAERDEVLIAGRLRSKTKRKITSGEAHLLPSYMDREELEKCGAEGIGNVWTNEGRIFCSAYIPSDAYFSMPASLLSGKLVEMAWRVNKLRYGKGEIDSIRLSCELSDLDEEARDYSKDGLALVDPLY